MIFQRLHRRLLSEDSSETFWDYISEIQSKESDTLLFCDTRQGMWTCLPCSEGRILCRVLNDRNDSHYHEILYEVCVFSWAKHEVTTRREAHSFPLRRQVYNSILSARRSRKCSSESQNFWHSWHKNPPLAHWRNSAPQCLSGCSRTPPPHKVHQTQCKPLLP